MDHYGLQFKNLHLVLVILLARDIATNPDPKNQHLRSLSCLATNPGPGIICTLRGLECLYLNARSLKAFVPVDSDPSMQNKFISTISLPW